jgi:hypothetical protein
MSQDILKGSISMIFILLGIFPLFQDLLLDLPASGQLINRFSQFQIPEIVFSPNIASCSS